MITHWLSDDYLISISVNVHNLLYYVPHNFFTYRIWFMTKAEWTRKVEEKKFCYRKAQKVINFCFNSSLYLRPSFCVGKKLERSYYSWINFHIRIVQFMQPARHLVLPWNNIKKSYASWRANYVTEKSN